MANLSLESRLLRIVSALAERAGNPYHDADGKFTSGPGGGHGREKRKRRRAKAHHREGLETLRGRLHERAEKMRRRHRNQKARVHQTIRLRKEEIANGARRKYDVMVKGPAIARYGAVKERHHAEKQSIRDEVYKRREDYDRARSDIHAWREKWAIKESNPAWKAEMHARVKEMRARHATERIEAKEAAKREIAEGRDRIKDAARKESARLKEWGESELSRLKGEHATEWERFRGHVQEMIGKEIGKGGKEIGKGGKEPSRSKDDDDLSGMFRRLDMHHTRVHKASEAGAILRHCLRRLGLLKPYRDGELTGQQTLDLLETLREYGRAWLRHESEVFARHHLGYEGAARAFEPYDPSAATKAFAANVGRFFRRAKTFVRELVVAGAMAVLGPSPLTGEDLDAVEAQARRQEQFFDRFEAEVVVAPPAIRPEATAEQVVYPPRMTPGEFVARTESYGSSVYSSGQEVARARYIRGKVFDQEQGVHVGADEPCPTCVERVAMGWRPIGTLRPIGDSECRCMCHCHLQFRLSSVPDMHYLLGKGGPMRAPA